MIRSRSLAAPALAGLFLAALPTAAAAQDDTRPRRTRVALGAQLVPDYPGADKTVVRPYIDLSRARGDDPFRYEAADESSGFPLFNRGRVSFGPSFAFEGARQRSDTDGRLPKVGFTVELGGFVQLAATDRLRLRAEARQGVGGHKGLIANLMADYVLRDGDRWLIAAGPRLTLADRGYQRAYFGIDRDDAAAAGLPAWRPGGGLTAAGAAITGIRQIGERWSVHGYVKYDRLVDDAGGSPAVRALGSRNQVSGGLALGYTFGG